MSARELIQGLIESYERHDAVESELHTVREERNALLLAVNDAMGMGADKWPHTPLRPEQIYKVCKFALAAIEEEVEGRFQHDQDRLNAARKRPNDSEMPLGEPEHGPLCKQPMNYGQTRDQPDWRFCVRQLAHDGPHRWER
jgi:hypothetical protein